MSLQLAGLQLKRVSSFISQWKLCSLKIDLYISVITEKIGLIFIGASFRKLEVQVHNLLGKCFWDGCIIVLITQNWWVRVQIYSVKYKSEKQTTGLGGSPQKWIVGAKPLPGLEEKSNWSKKQQRTGSLCTLCTTDHKQYQQSMFIKTC